MLEIEPAQYNLLELQNNVSALLADQEIPVGDYTQLRMMLDCSEENAPSIVIDGEEHELKIPSGCESGIKMPYNFHLESGDLTSLIMDFDVRKSVHQSGNGQYIMSPVIRVVDAATSGTITGQILPAEIGAVVYAFTQGTYNPDAADPFDAAFNSALPIEDGSFTLAALPAGTYDLVFAAEGYETDATLTGVEVTGGEETSLDPVELVISQ